MKIDRTPPPNLEAMFQQARATPSDINEHLDLLRALASECEYVTEFGSRGGVSTTALLAAQPKSLISWDISPYGVISQTGVRLIEARGRTNFQPRCGNTLEIEPIEYCDMLFVDTLHTYEQLMAELDCHGMRAAKYLVLHDTVSFGREGEDGSTPGLRAAIGRFQNMRFPVWQAICDLQNNNGLIVLGRE